MTLAVVGVFILSARGQGFQNLDFESAQNLPGNPGNGVIVSVANALPDWSFYGGTEINYVSNSLGNVSGAVELEGGSLALSGNWSVGLYNQGSISQTGMVPDNAESLQFEAYVPGASSRFAVTLGGITLGSTLEPSPPFSVLSQGPDYAEYGVNIPADMDGQSEALTFLIQIGGAGGVVLDNIEFSTSAIPEPSEYALLGLGAILFGLRHLRKGPAKKIQPIQG